MKKQGDCPIINITLENSNVENLNVVIGNNNEISQNVKIDVKRKKRNSGSIVKLKQMLVKFVTEIDVNILLTLLTSIFALFM